MKDVLNVHSKKEIPELNVYQCGTYKMHSLKEAKDISMKVITRGIKKMSNKKLSMSKKELEKANR